MTAPALLEELSEDLTREHQLVWTRRMEDREKLAKAQRLLVDLRLEHHDLGQITSLIADVISDRDKQRLSSPQEIRVRHLERLKAATR